jgi:putative component of membrane protein insertase Oxa1/YidC/SpoIIIJ protein YidD/TM2 domain-containing membrane protein YozV
LSKAIFLFLWLAGACLARYDALSVSGEWMIGAYKAVLSPLQGSNICNFSPTCSQFARGAIQTQGFLPGLLIGADRLMRCNTLAWSYYEGYYTGDVVSGRMPDPVANHVAWLRPPDEPGLLISARIGDRSPERSRGTRRGSVTDSARRVADVSPFSLSFADYLYSSGEYLQAAGEYLRVRFGSGQPGLNSYAGLMAGESYLRAGDLTQARHAFGDLSAPTVGDFRQYGIARTDFAAADYVGTRTALRSVTSPLLARQAKVLDGWTFFRQHRFAEGASRIGAIGSDEPSQRLSAVDGRDIRRRSRFASTLLSAIVPGAGQLYSGRVGDGAYSFLTVAGTGLVAWYYAADQTHRDRTHVKVSIFGVITALFYAGNVYGANIAARDYNLLQERRCVQRADSLFELMSLEPDYQSLLDSVPADTTSPGRE